MPDKIEKEEMLVHATIEKAKEVIQEAKHLGTMENKDDVNGETVKVKRPNKNPKEEKVKNPVSTDDVNSGYGLAGDDSEWKATLARNPQQIEESMPEYRKDVDTPAHVSNK